MRSMFKDVAVFGAALLSCSLPSAVLGQETGSSRPVDTIESGWQVICRPASANRSQLACTTLFEMASARDRARVLSIEVTRGSAGMQLVVGLPLGVDVRNGVDISGAGFEKLKAHVTTCTPGGCIATTDLPQKTLSQWRTGKTLIVEFGHANGGKFRSEIILAGFDQAIARAE